MLERRDVQEKMGAAVADTATHIAAWKAAIPLKPAAFVRLPASPSRQGSVGLNCEETIVPLPEFSV